MAYALKIGTQSESSEYGHPHSTHKREHTHLLLLTKWVAVLTRFCVSLTVSPTEHQNETFFQKVFHTVYLPHAIISKNCTLIPTVSRKHLSIQGAAPGKFSSIHPHNFCTISRAFSAWPRNRKQPEHCTVTATAPLALPCQCWVAPGKLNARLEPEHTETFSSCRCMWFLITKSGN